MKRREKEDGKGKIREKEMIGMRKWRWKREHMRKG